MKKNKKNKLTRLKKHSNVLNGNPESIVHMNWSKEWKKQVELIDDISDFKKLRSQEIQATHFDDYVKKSYKKENRLED